MTNNITQTSHQLILQPNALLNAKYYLATDEKKLILMALKEIITIKDITIDQLAQNQFFNIDLKELYKISNEKIEYKHFARRMRKSVENLWERKIILNEEKATTWIRWITQVNWEKNDTNITIKLSTEILSILLSDKKQGNFTPCKLNNMIMLNTSTSFRLYELLAQHEDFRNRTITIDNLRYMLVMEDRYLKHADFMYKIIYPAIKDISENSNYVIDQPIANKNGTKIESLTFNFKVVKGTLNKKHKVN